ncbi:hypothetical protein Ancab_001697 [Ancistrocladus abbreviatus]
MALFRKFFYRKPPDGLLEIAERVYVFDCCFTTDLVEDENYKVYIGSIVSQLREHLHDASFVVFNFREPGEYQSQIGSILSEYDMTVMDYPRQYEGCPLLSMEMIHYFLRSCESWLLLGQQNVLLMHCERGGWPVLSFMLAALLIYRKQYTGEQKTLDMINKQAPRELLQLMCPLNPLPSQLRYLQYVSRRNVGSEWPPLDRALTLDCIIIRFIPNIDGEGGCRPILRIYGQDPFLVADRTPKVLFSTPKRGKNVRYYKQLAEYDSQSDTLIPYKKLNFSAQFVSDCMDQIVESGTAIQMDAPSVDCELVKIDIHCHVQGDVVLECISLDDDLECEKMIFRVMFNTAFIRSNILMLNRDEINTLWDAKDLFPKEFRAEVLFSEMDSESSLIAVDLPPLEEKEGLPVEAFAKVQEIFNSVDWLDPKADVALNVLQQITSSSILREKLEMASSQRAETGSLGAASLGNLEKSKSQVSEFNIRRSASMALEKPKSQASEYNIRRSASMGLENHELTSKSSADTDLIEKTMDQETTVSTVLKIKSQTGSSQREELGSPEVSRPQKLSQIPVSEASEHNIKSSSSMGLENEQFPEQPSHSSNLIWMKSLQQRIASTLPEETLAVASVQGAKPGSVQLSCPFKEKPLLASESSISSASRLLEKSMPSTALSLDINLTTKKIQPEHSLPALQQHTQSRIISPRIPHSSLSCPSLYGNSLQGSSMPLPRYHSAPSSLGITAVLHDHARYENKDVAHLVMTSLPSLATSPITIPDEPKHEKPSLASSIAPSPPPVSTLTSPAIPSSTPPAPPPPPSHFSTSESTKPLDEGQHGTSAFSRVLPSSLPHYNLGPIVSHSTTNMLSKPSAPLALPLPAPPGLFSSAGNSFLGQTPPPPPPLSGAALSAVSADSLLLSSPKQSVLMPGPPPPPPPPCSPGPARASGPSSSPLAPPPPPPTASLKDNGSGTSPRAPPVPPPPAPSVKGSPKASDSSQQCHVPGSGPVPPAPGNLKGRGPPRLTPKSQGQSKRTSLKPYHWLKLTRVMHGSLWAEAQKADEASKAPEFDMSELESLFAASVPNSEHGGPGGKSNRRASGPKSDKVQLIELRRAYNCEIMLSKVKIPLPDLMNSVLALDDSALDVDQVENLIKFCPTKEEMELLKGYTGDKEKLGKCEQFFLELMKVPRVEAKLRVFSFEMQFGSQVCDLRKNLNLVNSASEEIRGSAKLKRIMQTILSLGNALNHGTARGSAVGFRLDSLLKLTDTRARNNKMTLMHYLCKVLTEKLPELLDFPRDLANLEASTKIQLKFLAEEMQAISKGLEKVVQELTASENDGPVSLNFCKTLKEFLSFAEGEVRSLASLYSNVGRNADALAMYFGEDPARCPFEQVVSTLLKLCEDVFSSTCGEFKTD